MSAMGDLEAWIALSLVPGVGNQTFHRLLEAFATPEGVFGQTQSKLKQFVSSDVAAAILGIRDEKPVAASMAWLRERNNRHVVTIHDSRYPSSLKQIYDPPPLLYVAGKVELLAAPSLAVVGSRNATAQGVANAEAFAEVLSNAGLCIVSGLALGIDAAAHRGALKGAAGTIAIIGTGIDRVYPARNRDLAHQIAEKGAIVSDFPLGTPALAGNFPRRNRIISGLALGCLVVEAATSSGSLITARLAAEHGREVFSIPGSIHSPLARGCHRLIKEGAKLVESADDVMDELGWKSSPIVGAASQEAHEHDGLLAHIGYDPQSLESIIQTTQLPTEQVLAALFELELAGLVESLPGGRYQRLAPRA